MPPLFSISATEQNGRDSSSPKPDAEEGMAAPGKCLLVTGAPGEGKTTLIARVVEALKASNPNLKVEGFYTREIRERGGQRVGFEVVTLDGHTAPLASCTISTSESFRWPTVGRYKVAIASFESLALPVLQVKKRYDLYIIDEIGKMELYSSSFLPAVLKVLESNVPVLAPVTVPKFGHDIPGVARVKNHPGVKIYTLIAGNRESIREQILPTVRPTPKTLGIASSIGFKRITTRTLHNARIRYTKHRLLTRVSCSVMHLTVH